MKGVLEIGLLSSFVSPFDAWQEGLMIHFEAHGHADLAAEKPMLPQTLFRLYSQTSLGHQSCCDNFRADS